ncbi:MAG TPA: hydrogenase maturation protease [Roseiflexaceae bacterium]|nr:hydrogenase maturation protease [Roseiflexaceae bacterium]
MHMRKILIAGMGNLLRCDDGFGVVVARWLAARAALPAGARVVEVGIGGIHLVQELMDGYGALVIVDAVERGSPPGTLHLLEAQVPDLATWPERQRQDFLADMHYTTPAKALILARALGVLPPQVLILGCQPAEADALGIGLSEPVERAAAESVGRIERIVRQLAGEARRHEVSGYVGAGDRPVEHRGGPRGDAHARIREEDRRAGQT